MTIRKMAGWSLIIIPFSLYTALLYYAIGPVAIAVMASALAFWACVIGVFI